MSHHKSHYAQLLDEPWKSTRWCYTKLLNSNWIINQYTHWKDCCCYIYWCLQWQKECSTIKENLPQKKILFSSHVLHDFQSTQQHNDNFHACYVFTKLSILSHFSICCNLLGFFGSCTNLIIPFHNNFKDTLFLMPEIKKNI